MDTTICSPLIFYKHNFYKMNSGSFSPFFHFSLNSLILWVAIMDRIPQRDTQSKYLTAELFPYCHRFLCFCLKGTRSSLLFTFKKQFSKQQSELRLTHCPCNCLCLTSLPTKGYFLNFFSPWACIHIVQCEYISTLQLLGNKLFAARFNGTSVEEAICWHILSSTVLHDASY